MIRYFADLNDLCRIVDGKDIHLVAQKNITLDLTDLNSSCIVARFNDDREECDILFTALHEVPCLSHARLIVQTMPCGVYRLSDSSSYSTAMDVTSHFTGNIPVMEVSADIWLEISKQAPKWPTTGLVALFILSMTNARSIHLYGFDVWARSSKTINLYQDKYINYSHFPPGIINQMKKLIFADARYKVHGLDLREIEHLWKVRLGKLYDSTLKDLVHVVHFDKVNYRMNTVLQTSSATKDFFLMDAKPLPLLRYSPLSSPGKAKLIKNLSINTLKSAYKNWLNIDVSSYYSGISSVSLYECLHSKIRFFYPPIKPGDSDFYSALQVNDWYYVKDKWEWQKAINLISENDRVLEVGCGNAQFLQSLSRNKQCREIVGLETNAGCFDGEIFKGLCSAINIKRSDLKSYIESHALKISREKFDVVCTFQVLEHINEPSGFLSDCKKILSPSGIMIHAVPNCGSFIKYTDENWCLNYPPHHFLLWSKESISYAAGLIGMTASFYSEPISRDQARWASSIYLEEVERRLARRSVFCSKVFRRLAKIVRIDKLTSLMLFLFKAEGHTLLCVLRSPDDHAT